MPAGPIDWIRPHLSACAKILIGEHTRIAHAGNELVYTEQRGNELIQLLGDTYPEAYGFCESLGRDAYAKGFNSALTHRAGHTFTNGELDRFNVPQWQPIRNVLMDAYMKKTRIHPYDMAHAIEQKLMIRYDGLPGVYIRHDDNHKELIYIGESQNIAKRKHTSSAMPLVEVIVTADKKAAQQLEQIIHHQITILGGVPMIGSRGKFRFPDGTDARNALTVHLAFFLPRNHLLKSTIMTGA